MGTTYKVRLGRTGERFAADMLKHMGFVILATNFKCFCGEVDIIARRGKELHFVEVKTRCGQASGRPAEAVTEKKQSRIRKTADYYLSRIDDDTITAVFDVISIDIEYIENCM